MEIEDEQLWTGLLETLRALAAMLADRDAAQVQTGITSQEAAAHIDAVSDTHSEHDCSAPMSKEELNQMLREIRQSLLGE